ncbi:MAG: Maf family protein [bacterium]
MRLVLASRSPRRADLLRAAGYEFEVAPADIDERQHDGEPVSAYVARLAEEKAAMVGRRVPGAIVIGADTIVVIDGVALGKPSGDVDAGTMLRRLSGRRHDVLTGVALHAVGRGCCEVARTQVDFRVLSVAEIAWYVGSGEPDGKAGAYAIQGRASRFVTRIDGSYSNVVGLPIAVVDRLLGTLDANGSARRIV